MVDLQSDRSGAVELREALLWTRSLRLHRVGSARMSNAQLGIFVLLVGLSIKFPLPTIVCGVLSYVVYYLLSNLLGQVGDNLLSSNGLRRDALLSSHGINEKEGKKLVVGFFHPYCNAGGGGEKVLWFVIDCLLKEEDNAVAVVYSGDAVDSPGAEILAKVETRFDISLDRSRVIFVPLRKRWLVEDSTYPRLTLIGQSLGSILVAFEGLTEGLIPDVWVDTMGYAFAYPLMKRLARCAVGSYTHYPTISTDMLERVRNRTEGHTNKSVVTRSAVLSYAKLGYYQLFAKVYAICLRDADVLMVNSSWTKNHIDSLLGSESTTKAKTVFPPCDTKSLATSALENRKNVILSVAQFRPEKDHEVQLRALKLLFQRKPQFENGPGAVKLVLAGSVRGAGDSARVVTLKALAEELELEHSVQFVVSAPYAELVELFNTSSVGLHTMVDEHFGITVVEMLAAGLVPIVHASAGPFLDIVTPFEGAKTGFHAKTMEEFADRLEEVLEMDERERRVIRENARRGAERFSDQVFEDAWAGEWKKLKALVAK